MTQGDSQALSLVRSKSSDRDDVAEAGGAAGWLRLSNLYLCPVFLLLSIRRLGQRLAADTPSETMVDSRDGARFTTVTRSQPRREGGWGHLFVLVAILMAS